MCYRTAMRQTRKTMLRNNDACDICFCYIWSLRMSLRRLEGLLGSSSVMASSQWRSLASCSSKLRHPNVSANGESSEGAVLFPAISVRKHCLNTTSTSLRDVHGCIRGRMVSGLACCRGCTAVMRPSCGRHTQSGGTSRSRTRSCSRFLKFCSTSAGTRTFRTSTRLATGNERNTSVY